MSNNREQSYIANHSNNVANNNVLFIQADEKDKIILYILTDYVMWQRVSNAMHRVINCFSSNDEYQFEPEEQYAGYIAAIDYIGVKEGNLRDKMCSAAYDIEDDIPAKEAAISIYTKWLSLLKDYSLSNFKPAV